MYLTDPPQSLWLLSPPMVLSSGPFLMSSPQTCSGREDIRQSPPLDPGGGGALFATVARYGGAVNPCIAVTAPTAWEFFFLHLELGLNI